MRARTILVTLSVATVCTAAIVVAWTQEVTVTLDQVPAPVKATILTESAGGILKEIESETRNGTTVYEAEIQVDGRTFDLRMDAEGKVLNRPGEFTRPAAAKLTLDQVPKPVRTALLHLANGAAIAEIERNEHGQASVYGATWSVNGMEHEASFTEDGALVETEETLAVEEAPGVVRAAIEKHFAGVPVTIEKKTIIVYELSGKVNGHTRELMVTPTGRVAEEDAGDEGHDDDDGDDDGGDDDDGDDD